MNETTENLFVMWLLTGLSVVIMLLRLVLRWFRLGKFELGDYFTIAAVVALLIRSASETVPIVWGTNQGVAKTYKTFTHEQIYQREIGSKLTIVNRIFYTVYIWLQKSVVMCVIQTLLKGLGHNIVIIVSWSILAATFVPAAITCLVECHPFVLYWQVVPPPGKCAAGALQLVVFSILEMVTDLMLIVLPVRHLLKLQLSWIARLRLVMLFSVGLSVIAVTLLRLLMNVLKLHRSGASHDIANVEILFAAIVANAPGIYGLIRTKIGTSARSGSKGSALQDVSGRSRELRTIGSGVSSKRRTGNMYMLETLQHSDEECIIQDVEHQSANYKSGSIASSAPEQNTHHP